MNHDGGHFPGGDASLRRLAEAAGIALEWLDYQGRPQTVQPATLRRLLAALGHRCGDEQETSLSLQALTAAADWPVMATGRVGEPLLLPVPPDTASGELHAELLLEESGETEVLKAAIVSPPAMARQEEVWNGQTPGVAIGLSLGPVGTPGYHLLTVTAGGRTHQLTLAIAPRRAYRVEDAIEDLLPTPQPDGPPPRVWGTAVQLYGLPPEAGRRLGDAGIGDFTALAALAGSAAHAGAHALAISPTHAGFAADPSRFSPYSPSSRWFANVLHIDPAAVFGAELAQAAARRAGIQEGELAALRDAPQIDWPRSGALKQRWLRALFELVDAPRDAVGQVLGEGGPSGWEERFDHFIQEQGEPLALHACFEALHAHFSHQGLGFWGQWPPAFQDPHSAEVEEFKRSHAADVRFHAFLQWLADTGLAQAQQAAREAGMAVGLVSDLAVGMDGGGSHAWSRPDDLLTGLEVGAPPDMLNTDGQTWGLTALSPRALRGSGFAPFLATLRAAMRHAGGVRIDHVLGLKRLWLVPQGAPAGEGAYLHYPFEDLLNLVALESHRQRAIVIGEDLGTVPAGLREKLAELSILGMRVLWFERDPVSEHGAGFLPPSQWPRDAVALTDTHDLATAAGWWEGNDIGWRERIGIGGDPAAARAERARDRAALLRAGAGALGDDPSTVTTEAAVDLAIDQVAATPASLAIVPLEDLLGLVEQPNLPGTVHEHPNWRRRLPLPADRLLAETPALERAGRLTRARGLE